MTRPTAHSVNGATATVESAPKFDNWASSWLVTAPRNPTEVPLRKRPVSFAAPRIVLVSG